MKQNNALKYIELRKKYPTFFFDDYHVELVENGCIMQFDFHFADYYFHPKMKLNCGKYWRDNINLSQIDALCFQIGMIELISYWKCCCSPEIIIKPSRLTDSQQQWWKDLYFNGLGEFFYQNLIPANIDNFCFFSFPTDAKNISPENYERIDDSSSVIVPIGGGKDSVVTLENLPKESTKIPFIINPRGATLSCAAAAGYTTSNDIVILERQIDAQLLKLNADGFLNGHTPFSAMLAFYTLLVSYCTGAREIALSNESSASEPTIPNTTINHQYSKSLDFEEKFRQYVKDFMNDCAHYYSFLRPYTELQIAEMFAQHPNYFFIFKSCNAGSKEDIWCCKCAKCLFAYIILSPFIEDQTMIKIFGKDLLDDADLILYFDELTGIAENKPFECVGTLDEVNRAIQMILPSRKDKYLIKHYIEVKLK